MAAQEANGEFSSVVGSRNRSVILKKARLAPKIIHQFLHCHFLQLRIAVSPIVALQNTTDIGKPRQLECDNRTHRPAVQMNMAAEKSVNT